MRIEKNGNITVVTQELATTKHLINSISQAYSKYENEDLIIVFSSLNPMVLETILEFLSLSNTHRASNNSFVLVSDKVNLEDMPDEIVVVPTIQEAYDIIEMEAIERDLGF